MRSSNDLPPLQSLRVFEAVGRLLSFRQAGEELLITQSAVSHHIRKLELFLGISLFDRRTKNIALTQSGGQYLEAVTSALSQISDATAELTRMNSRRKIRIGLPPSAAANWLISRIGDFAQEYPGLDLELAPSMRALDLGAGEADLSIVYGDGKWPDLNKTLLCQENLRPVLSPDLAARQPFDQPEHVYNHTVLYSRSNLEWPLWLETFSIDPKRLRVLQLTDYNLVLQAALDGEGVAMGRALLVRDRLKSGALVSAPIPPVSSVDFGHWILVTKKAAADQPIRDVMKFLTDAARDAAS